MSLVSTVFLSTDTISNFPISNRTSSQSASSVTWNIDWDQLFKGKTGLCKVSINMLSKKGPLPTSWDLSGNGSISSSFSSPYGVSSNGFQLAMLNRNQYIEIDGASNVASVYYFLSDTTKNTVNPVINIPIGKNAFTINMMDSKGVLLPLFPEYSIFLYFEWLDNKNSFSNI